MTPLEIRAIVRELASFCANDHWGMQTTLMAEPIHERLSTALSDRGTRRVVREALSQEIEAAPSAALAFFVVVHALEDGDSETLRILANHPNGAVRGGVIDGLVHNEVHGVPFLVEAMRDVSPAVRELACAAFDFWGHEREGPLPLELFAARLEDGDAGVRREAATLVGRLLKHGSFELAPLLSRFVELLDDASAGVQGAAAFAICSAAEIGLDIEACTSALQRHAESPDSGAASIARGILRRIASGEYPLARRRQS